MTNLSLAQPGNRGPGQPGQRPPQRRLVALDSEQIVGAAGVQVVSVRALAVQRIAGDHGRAQVRHGVEHGCEGGQLIAVDHCGLGQHQMLDVVERRHQLHPLALVIVRPAQGLAVHGQHGAVLATRLRVVPQRPPAGSAASQHPPGQGALQRGRIDRRKYSPERGRMRRRTAHGYRLLGAAGPLRDGRVRTGAGQHGADREQQDRLQTVTAAAGPARIRDGSQRLQQADRLGRIQPPRCQAGLGDCVDHDGWGR